MAFNRTGLLDIKTFDTTPHPSLTVTWTDAEVAHHSWLLMPSRDFSSHPSVWGNTHPVIGSLAHVDPSWRMLDADYYILTTEDIVDTVLQSVGKLGWHPSMLTEQPEEDRTGDQHHHIIHTTDFWGHCGCLSRPHQPSWPSCGPESAGDANRPLAADLKGQVPVQQPTRLPLK